MNEAEVRKICRQEIKKHDNRLNKVKPKEIEKAVSNSFYRLCGQLRDPLKHHD